MLNLCDNNINNIIGYLDGSLSDTKRVEFEAHLNHCHNCSQTLLVVQQGKLAARSASRYLPSESLTSNTKAAIRVAALKHRFMWPRRVAFAGAVACVVTVSLVVWHPYTHREAQYGINKLLIEDHTTWQNSEAFSDPALVEIRTVEHL